MTDQDMALKGLVEMCEQVRDNSSYNSKRWHHETTSTQWSAFCLQIKVAKAALEKQPSN
jgi:hypothetical protein